MGRFDATKATIDANIKSNGNQEITGDILNSVMKGMVDATDAELTEQSAKLAQLSEETDARFNESDHKFASVDSKIENLKRGEAYVMGDRLMFRNYADAQIFGNTLKL